MTERKVLNKYFPPDFDPAKIPRLKGMKKEKVFSIRTMAPFNMMCLTCREYIFKAKKFNSRMEECEYTYLNLKEYRFHIRCPTCCSEIVYRTDRENNDYVVESGAKRSFEAYTTAIRQAIKESVQEKEELKNNPIKALEKRTEESVKEFKMSNKVQDLMEQSKSDGSREGMIEDALALIRQRAENEKMAYEKHIKDLFEKQKQIQHEKDIERASKAKAIYIPVFDRIESMRNAKCDGKSERLNALKEAVKRRREKEAKLQTSEDCSSAAKLQILEIPQLDNKNSKPTDSDTRVKMSPVSSCNILGLDYESDD